MTRGLGRLLEDVFGGSVGGGFLGVRGWVKEIQFVFLNASSKNQKSAHLPFPFRPHFRVPFLGRGLGGCGGLRMLHLVVSQRVPFSSGVLSPALPLFLSLAPAPPLSPPAAFASLLSHRYSQLYQKTGIFPGGHPLRSVAARQTPLHLQRQAAAHNVDQNPIFRYFENIIQYSFKAVSDYGYNPERSLLK